MMDLLAEASAELLNKSREQIERETAFKWAARAVAAYQLSQGYTSIWARDAVTYADEAVEHAALADSTGEVLRQVREWMYQYIPRGAL
jgi:hypothetical protein